ncbi:LysR family transcriptional regulator [Roseicyclus sp. F158]|uniref:LysR family transcriptional regulator n=1 Tax=Tropicimonas omnivorans TaxID=3075590 RepID=A0ABU3DFG5_9RHOB|nr:LysR family transcriptional regulator [Roseicyclus sp. F158]MDT0682458.1 LysR family transcriptional regulator [Roseicyclus sp. F158]
MRLIDMRSFVVLARNRHFGRTATEMNTTQPAISARLAGLERDLGHRLVERGEGRFALTAGGQETLRRFEKILGDVDDLRETLSGGPALSEPIRIGAIDSVSSTWMRALVDALHMRFPDLPVELTVDTTKALTSGMERGEFDLIFCLRPVLGESYRSYSACVFQMTWAGSARLIDPDRTYTVSDLARLPIISFPEGSPPYEMIAPYFHDERALASKLTSCNSLYAIISMMMDGFGVGAVPAVTIDRELHSGALYPLAVAKRFPAMPILASFQTATRSDLIREVVREARKAAGTYCASVRPDLAWVD